MFKLNHRPWITTNCHLRLTSQLIKFEKSLTSPEVDLYSWQQRKPTPQSYRQVNTLPKICYVPVIVTPRDSAIQTNNILLNMSILTWLSQEIIQVNVSSMIITRLVCRMKNMECNRVYVLLYRPNIIRFQYCDWKFYQTRRWSTVSECSIGGLMLFFTWGIRWTNDL